jgi:hypothetical protein
MQIVREIIVGFKWEQDAMGRSQQCFVVRINVFKRTLKA